jgi:dihydroxyacetone kinase-like protein
MKKLINDPFDFVEESLEGFVLAHESSLKRAGKRAVARADAPVAGKVGVVIGGGSGHLPAFAGYVGRGGADAVPIGNIFASPPAKPILEATLAADGGAGVLYSYGNYAGDVMNFDRAAARAGELGIPVETVLVTDDVASAPKGEESKRRGIAGDFFVFKVAAAMAETKADLACVAKAARKANANTRTMGVALSACTVPANGRPTFSLAEDTIEIGLGIHGEPGMRSSAIVPADNLVDELCDHILADLDYSGHDVAVLVNGLGATPYEELYLLYRRLRRILPERNVTFSRSYVGEYVTSLEMAGASVTLMRLDDELLELLDAPAFCPMFIQPGGPRALA